ncbi:MAG: cupin domain-containing protein [Saprospiraceae bacterium]|nr:cupin domain-containing protein [Saprospiraceae bacterium]
MSLSNTILRPFTLLLLAVVTFAGCNANEQAASEEATSESIFPKGRKGPADFFTGTAWVHGLVANDSVFTTNAGSVTFEPAARSHWHSHPSGQILMVTAGVGYHQIKGQPKEIIKKGDVIKCPPNKVHWHGASEGESMTHIYLIPNTEKGIVEWKDPVTDEEFTSK